MSLKPFAHLRRAKVKKFELSAGEVVLLTTVIENPQNGGTRKILRKIDRIMDKIEFTGDDIDIEDKKNIEIDDDDWDFMYKAFQGFSQWTGKGDVRKRILSLEDKLDLIEKGKYELPKPQESPKDDNKKESKETGNPTPAQ